MLKVIEINTDTNNARLAITIRGTEEKDFFLPKRYLELSFLIVFALNLGLDITRILKKYLSLNILRIKI